jgi:hypothetical protein
MKGFAYPFIDHRKSEVAQKHDKNNRPRLPRGAEGTLRGGLFSQAVLGFMNWKYPKPTANNR